MKRYKLLKDLPLYEAKDSGFYIDPDGNLMHRAAYAGETVYPAAILVRHPEILTEWFEEISEQPKTVWDLKEGDACYQISGTIIMTCEWKNCEGLVLRRSIGDITLTAEEAKKKVAWREAREILLRDTKGFRPDWKNLRKQLYGVGYDLREKELKFIYCNDYATSNIWFATQADAEASIKAHPNEWKTYLGVE